jgi:DNA-binding Lrp family transcriptional regulator
VVGLDEIDKGILLTLDTNCRMSYETLARRFGISANAIKKRVAKLVETGVIEQFGVWLSLAMLGADHLLGLIYLNDIENEEAFIETLGANPMIHYVGFLSDGTCHFFAQYIGAQGLSDLGRFLRGLDGVTSIELHPLLSQKGKHMELTTLQLRVLKSLFFNDARLSIAHIAKHTGLTARRVRKVLEELRGDKGSIRPYIVSQSYIEELRPDQEAVHFRIKWNLNAEKDTSYMARISYDESQTTPYEVVDWLRDNYSFEYWYSFASALEPTLFSVFVVNHLRQAEGIARHLKGLPFIKQVKTLVLYPQHNFEGLREIRLKELFSQAGL